MGDVSRAQGLLLGRLADVGMVPRDQASLLALTEDVVKTSAIEGEQLDVESVRSSIARRLGVDVGALAPVDRHVEGWSRWCSTQQPTATPRSQEIAFWVARGAFSHRLFGPCPDQCGRLA